MSCVFGVCLSINSPGCEPSDEIYTNTHINQKEIEYVASLPEGVYCFSYKIVETIEMEQSKIQQCTVHNIFKSILLTTLIASCDNAIRTEN